MLRRAGFGTVLTFGHRGPAARTEIENRIAPHGRPGPRGAVILRVTVRSSDRPTADRRGDNLTRTATDTSLQANTPQHATTLQTRGCRYARARFCRGALQPLPHHRGKGSFGALNRAQGFPWQTSPEWRVVARALRDLEKSSACPSRRRRHARPRSSRAQHSCWSTTRRRLYRRLPPTDALLSLMLRDQRRDLFHPEQHLLGAWRLRPGQSGIRVPHGCSVGSGARAS